MLTPFGIAIRKMRLDKGMRLLDLADRLKMSAAYVSAVETGKKPIPDKYVALAARAMELNVEEARSLQSAADRTREIVRVDQLAADQRELVAVFARGINTLPPELAARLKKAVFKYALLSAFRPM